MDDEFDSLTFEEALRSLEETVTLLESGNLTLEESLMLFERGQKLAAHCGRVLDRAELRVEMLTDTGELVDRSTLA
jgi:exodeoxyribonuclease VII small subunit